MLVSIYRIHDTVCFQLVICVHIMAPLLCQAMEQQLSEKSVELEKLKKERDALQQKVADNLQDKKLHEKKGAGLV